MSGKGDNGDGGDEEDAESTATFLSSLSSLRLRLTGRGSTNRGEDDNDDGGGETGGESQSSGRRQQRGGTAAAPKHDVFRWEETAWAQAYRGALDPLLSAKVTPGSPFLVVLSVFDGFSSISVEEHAGARWILDWSMLSLK